MNRLSDSIAQDSVQQLLNRLVEEGAESAVQAAAYWNGQLIVDAWAGAPVETPDRKINGDHLFPIFSTSKGITATAIHRLVDRGLLNYDNPIAHYWPEFAQKGKGGITLRHALAHTAGVPNLPEHGRVEDLCDWDGMCRTLAASPPLHPPGAKFHYHAITCSWTIGEVARRVDGRPFARIIQEEVCLPLGLTSLFIGIPEGLDHLIVKAERIPTPPRATPAPIDPAIPPWIQPLEDMINRPDIRRACLGGCNGLANARSIARHYAGLLAGGVDGVELLTAATRREVGRWVVPTEVDLVDTRRYGLGYALSGPETDLGMVIGHGGYGGSNGFADHGCGLAVGVVKSRMTDGTTASLVNTAIRESKAAEALNV